MEELQGEYDVTIPLHDIFKYANESDPAGWIIVKGRPRMIRPNGRVYIRTEGFIVGSVRALGTDWLDERPERTGDVPGDRGPGPVVVVDPATWQTSQMYDLSEQRETHGQGIRYVITNDDSSIQHVRVSSDELYGDPIPPFTRVESSSGSLSNDAHNLTGDEAGAEGWLFEGSTSTVTVVRYERSGKARKRCIDMWGTQCSVCEMDFQSTYGELGSGFIHVHHLTEISTIGAEYKLDPIKDLRPLCPNCHAMVHRRSPALSIAELRVLFNQAWG